MSEREAARLAALAGYHILDSPPEAAFDDLARLAARLLAAPIAIVSFIDSRRLWCKAQVGLGLKETSRESSFCDYAILQDDIFVVPDAQTDPRFSTSPWVTEGPKARFYAGAPLINAAGRPLGVLAVLDRVPRKIDEAQRETLRALARQVMALVEQRRELSDLSLRNSQLHLLSEMSRKLLGCSSPTDTHAIIAEFGRHLLPEDSGRVFLATGPAGDMISAASWGDLPRRPERVSPGDCLALRNGQPFIFTAKGEPRCKHLENLPLQPSVCVPLETQDQTVGLLTLIAGPADPELPAPTAKLGEAKCSVAVAMAESVALAVGQLRMRETLESQSVRDPLTALFNRRYLEESLERELAHAARNRRPLGLIMVDLDRFKGYNDHLGHPAGDELLRRIADLLKHGVRAGDIACRYGGDEFAIILPGAALETTRVRAIELLEAVKGLNAAYGGSALQTVTLSTGVAAFPEHGANAHDLLHSADVALYQAKAQGRDRAVVFIGPSRSE
ncbi:MAG: diguanylate cyclase [Acidobacteriota bacterium]|nr:diguanylate cyclase [Acidobacteriota bacterium]